MGGGCGVFPGLGRGGRRPGPKKRTVRLTHCPLSMTFPACCRAFEISAYAFLRRLRAIMPNPIRLPPTSVRVAGSGAGPLSL